nr:hypothetical protein [Tanacetum cinerariifolium]
DHDPSQFFIILEDDNDDENYNKESIISMNTDIFETPSSDAITTTSLSEAPKDSLIMEDEDINTIPEKESDEENKSSVENLFHIPSESEFETHFESEEQELGKPDLVLIKIIPPIEIVLSILNERESGRLNLICNHLRSETGVPLNVTQFGSTALIGVGVGDRVGAEYWFFLSRSNALTISLS